MAGVPSTAIDRLERAPRGRDPLRVTARTVGGGFAGLGLLWIAWAALFTYADPDVQVPGPVRHPLTASADAAAARVLFLGDTAPTDAALPLIDRHGYGYPFERTRKLLTEHDAVVANLEAPVTTSEEPWPLPKRWIYKVHPAALPAARAAGIDVVTLANNHAYDYGRRGLADTLRELDEAGIGRLGAGMSEAEARRGLVLETAGGRLGLLSYMENKTRWRLWTMPYALDTPFRSFPGVARLRYSDLGADLTRLKRQADVVVVLVHWGENYQPIDDRQRRLGRACVELGADAVIGHHPHQFQPVGLVNGRPVVYSLGNYAFGTIGRRSMRFGMGAALWLEGGRLRGIELIPILTQNRIVEYRPRMPGGSRLERFMSELIRGSARHGATIERRGNRAWLSLNNIVE